MDERMDAPNGKRIVELLRKAAKGGYEGEKSRVMDNLAQLIGCYGAMDYRTIDKLADMVEEAIQHEHESAYDAGYDAGFASADDWCGQHEDEMAEHGWVKLPKDADGEYIHVGDKVTCGASVWEVTGFRFTGGFWGICCTIFNDQGGSGTNVYPPSDLHHYHEPTVEDVLREFALRVAGKECMTARPDVITEYAAKLRLAGGDAE